MFSSSVVYALLTASLFGRAEGFMASSSSTVSSCGVDTRRHAPCRNSGVSSRTDRNRIQVMMAGGASTDDDRDRPVRVSGGGRDSWESGNRCSSNSSRKERKRRTKTRL
ncbi:unnamed protein product, partial [Ectocarpus sp. 12 AP-2014]